MSVVSVLHRCDFSCRNAFSCNLPSDVTVRRLTENFSGFDLYYERSVRCPDICLCLAGCERQNYSNDTVEVMEKTGTYKPTVWLWQ